MGDGFARLAGVVRAAGRKYTPREALRDWADLGTIQADGGLLLDRFARPFPPGRFDVAAHLLVPDPMCAIVVELEDGPQVVPVPRPPQLAPPAPGDRVAVLWLNDGTEPLVVAVRTRAA